MGRPPDLPDTMTALLIYDIEKSDGDTAAWPRGFLGEVLHEAKVSTASELFVTHCWRETTSFNHVALLPVFLMYSPITQFNTLRTSDADLRFYITTVQDG